MKFLVLTNDGNSYTIEANSENEAREIVTNSIFFTSIKGVIQL